MTISKLFPQSCLSICVFHVHIIWNPSVNNFKLPANISLTPLRLFSHAACGIYLAYSSSVFVIPPLARATGLIVDILQHRILQPYDSEPYLSVLLSAAQLTNPTHIHRNTHTCEATEVKEANGIMDNRTCLCLNQTIASGAQLF